MSKKTDWFYGTLYLPLLLSVKKNKLPCTCRSEIIAVRIYCTHGAHKQYGFPSTYIFISKCHFSTFVADCFTYNVGNQSKLENCCSRLMCMRWLILLGINKCSFFSLFRFYHSLFLMIDQKSQSRFVCCRATNENTITFLWHVRSNRNGKCCAHFIFGIKLNENGLLFPWTNCLSFNHSLMQWRSFSVDS